MNPHEHALAYVGVPFRHRGRSRPTKTYSGALDCLGLLVVTAEDMGLPVLDKKIYGREPWRDGLRAGLKQNCGDPVQRELRVNDIVLFRLRPKAEPSHVGIIAPHPTGGLGIIHTYGEIGRVAFHRLDKHRESLIVEVYQWPAKH
jgi:hypothetical protein